MPIQIITFSLDGIDKLADTFQGLSGSLDHLDELMPQMLEGLV